MHIHIHTHVHIHIYIYMYIYLYLFPYLYLYLYVYVYIYIYTYTHIYVYTWIYTLYCQRLSYDLILADVILYYPLPSYRGVKLYISLKPQHLGVCNERFAQKD